MNTRLGTVIHSRLSQYLKGERNKHLKSRFGYLDDFLCNLGWTIVHVEKTFKRDNVCGRVDAIFKDADGKFILIDWKYGSRPILFRYRDDLALVRRFRGKNSFILQLNLYRWLSRLENVDMYVARINYKKIILEKCPQVSDDDIKYIVDIMQKCQ